MVSASREIAAKPGRIFELIADPAQQPRWDGNQNLAWAAAGQRVHRAGDVFTMTLTVDGSVRENHVTEYLISFPSGAMDDIPEEEMPAVGEAAHAAVREAKDAGVLLHAGGLDEEVEPVMVAGDGTVTGGTYPETKELGGGFTVVNVSSREAALEWATKFAAACCCAQEVRAFGFDPLV